MNKVILLGRIGTAPEVKTFDNGGKVCRISLATDESYKDRNGQKVEATEWHNVQFGGKSAEIAEKYLNKGDQILVEGKIKTRSWEQNGEKKYTTEIHALKFEFGKSAVIPSPQTQPQPSAPQQQAPQPLSEDEADLPF